MKLNPFEITVLRSLAGEKVSNVAWGAAMSAAMETLAVHGFIVGESDGTVTNKGREYLAIQRHAIDIRADEMAHDVIIKDNMNSVATIEMSVLKILNEYYKNSEGGQAYYTWKIAEGTGLPEEYARCALLSLRNKGMAIWARGLFDDDGMTAGSGYAITEQGQNYLAAELVKI